MSVHPRATDDDAGAANEADTATQLSERERADSWWYGGAAVPVGPETPVVTRGGQDARLHAPGCDEVPSADDDGMRNWNIGRLRDHPPAFRTLCTECWPPQLRFISDPVATDDNGAQCRLTTGGGQ